MLGVKFPSNFAPINGRDLSSVIAVITDYDNDEKYITKPIADNVGMEVVDVIFNAAYSYGQDRYGELSPELPVNGIAEVPQYIEDDNEDYVIDNLIYNDVTLADFSDLQEFTFTAYEPPP